MNDPAIEAAAEEMLAKMPFGVSPHVMDIWRREVIDILRKHFGGEWKPLGPKDYSADYTADQLHQETVDRLRELGEHMGMVGIDLILDRDGQQSLDQLVATLLVHVWTNRKVTHG